MLPRQLRINDEIGYSCVTTLTYIEDTLQKQSELTTDLSWGWRKSLTYTHSLFFNFISVIIYSIK